MVTDGFKVGKKADRLKPGFLLVMEGVVG